MTDLQEAKRKRRKKRIKVTYTTGDPELNIKHFNKMMGTDFNNPSTEEAKAAAKGANANMGIESNGSSGNADIGEIVGGTNEAGTDFGGESSGGEGIGESLELHEAKREVRRYFIRPQHIFCANKSEVIKALIDIGENNCSVYTLKYLGDEKDITKLTNRDIIYYYDDGILYDKNHVKVMDYDLYIKHEEERKKFSQPAEEIPDKEFDKEYEDRITHRTEFEESINQKKSAEQFIKDMAYDPVQICNSDDGEGTADDGDPIVGTTYYLGIADNEEGPGNVFACTYLEWSHHGGVGDEGNCDVYDTLKDLLEAAARAIEQDTNGWEDISEYDLADIKQYIKKLTDNPELNKKLSKKLLENETLDESYNPFEQDFPNVNAFGEDLDHPKHICCICGEEFEGYGNNPAPVKNDGVCCDACNMKFVIPARLDQINAAADDPTSEE